ncbi:L-lysine exporter family protein LysE/ArgO [Melghirimyces profundicolus]|uniref:L-lysine exporter family protein LysE/ArgO n=1 Tax=Melghirimyces profundicolus TaxID=1242148 RepID=A0A2T6C0F0_9BACL|nr:LysE/ArgO family amino acid transporter [Melghirimyces profundicolus]PTX61782.1 L-lysine exporter family protein LysE/ArgO [Melghirimyces profundicolus]
MTEAAVHGILLAFGLILPLGAQNVFVFNQGASQPTLLRAVPVILTAALCDTLLIVLAVLGVSLVLLTFPWLKLTLFGAGFLFLLYMGWTVWKSAASPSPSQDGGPLTAKRQIAFALSVSLLNPHAILDTVGVIGTNSLQYDSPEKWVFTGACAAVSWLWFLGLAVTGRVIGRTDTKGNVLQAVNRLSALIIWGVAVYIAFGFVQEAM